MRTLRWFQFDPEREIISLEDMELVEENEDDSPSTYHDESVA
jgi:hypothetical protein